MKIVICGSISFAKDMLELGNALEKLDHEVILPDNLEKYTRGEIKVEDKWKKKDKDLIKEHYNHIKDSDAVLIVNKNKKGIKNYFGGNSLMEMGFAHVLGKKIFLLNPAPTDLNYSDEIMAMNPII